MSESLMNLPKHRGGECPDCEGEGRESDDCEHLEVHDEMERPWLPCPDCPECEWCDGHGDVLWMWRPNIAAGTAECSKCEATGVETMGYGEDGEDGEVCLACYLGWHARECGCDAWPKEVTP